MSAFCIIISVVEDVLFLSESCRNILLSRAVQLTASDTALLSADVDILDHC